MTLALNDQQQAVKAALLDPSVKKLVVDAGPGAGKTAVIKAAYQTVPTTDYKYFAFNRAIVDEAKRKLTGNGIYTFHGYFRGLSGGKYDHRLNRAGLNGEKMATHLGIMSEIELPESGEVVSRTQQARIISAALRHYALSDSRDIGPWNIKPIRGYSPNDMKILRAVLTPFCVTAWEDIKSYNGKLTFRMEYFIKLFCWRKMGKTTKRAAIDEAQDLFKVLEYWLRCQNVPWALIGDPRQEVNAWTGASDAMSSPVTEGALRLSMPVSYRFGTEIADLANILQPFTGKQGDAIIGAAPYASVVTDYIENPAAILCRTNSGVLGAAITELEKGRKVAMPERQVTELTELAKMAADLMAGRVPENPDYSAFQSWEQFKAWVKDDPEGQDYAVSVKLITEHGPQGITDLLSKVVPADMADVLVSTAHKTKGMEWESVQMGSDWINPADDKEIAVEEALSAEYAMLLYVAFTRARMRLGVGSAKWATELIHDDEMAELETV